MSETLDVEILTPSKVAFQGKVEWIELKGPAGLMEILPGHADMVGTVDIGMAKLGFPGGFHFSIAVHGGILEVGRQGKGDDVRTRALVLASEAEHPEEIDAERAEDAKARALAALADDPSDPARVMRDKLRAEARLGAFKSYEGKKDSSIEEDA